MYKGLKSEIDMIDKQIENLKNIVSDFSPTLDDQLDTESSETDIEHPKKLNLKDNSLEDKRKYLQKKMDTYATEEVALEKGGSKIEMKGCDGTVVLDLSEAV